MTPWNEGKVGCPGGPCALNSEGMEERVIKKDCSWQTLKNVRSGRAGLLKGQLH